MADINQEARIPVYINDEQAKSALHNLQNEADKWRKKMYEAMAGGDMKGMKDAERELKKVNSQMSQLKKEAFDVNKVLSNISAASPKDLKKAIQALNRDMEDLNRNTKEYAAKQEQLKLLRAEFYGVNSAIREQRGLLSKTADFVNRYWSILSGVALTFVGIKSTMDDATKASGDFEERVDNLSALTGLAGDNLEWLEKKAKDLSTSTLEGSIKVKQGAQEIVDAFTKVGSKRPELLKVKEDLVSVTQEAIILANAAKTDLDPAVAGLTMTLNQFNMKASESRRIINVFAAGSKVGAGEIPYLTQAMEKSGTTANLMKIPLEQWGGAIEAVAPYYEQAEVAGRSFDRVLLKMREKQIGYVNGQFDMNTALDQLEKKFASGTSAADIFEVEHAKMAELLVKERANLNEYTKAMTGSNTAIEQATINTDNRNAKLAQAQNRLQNVRIELGEKLTPILTMSTSASTLFLKVLSAIVSILYNYGGVIVTAGSAVLGYTAAVKIATLWETKNNAEKGIGLALTKLKVFWHGAERGALLLSAAAQALLTGNITRATAAMRVFNATTKMNPIGLLVGILAAGMVALAMYSRGLTAAQKAQKALNDISIDAQKNIAEEKVKLDLLLKTARNKNLSDETRKKAIKEINELSPEHLGNLTLEKINTEEARKATDNYTASLLKNAKAQAAKEKLVEIEKQLIDLQNGEGVDPTFWQNTWNSIASGGNSAIFALRSTNTVLDNFNEKQKELLETRKKVQAMIEKPSETGSGGGGGGNDDKAAQDLIALKEKELENAKAIIATTPAEVAARNKKVEAIQNEINKLNQLGTSKEGKADDPIVKKKIEQIEAANNAEMAAIKKRYLEGKTTEDEYNGELLAQELKFLTDKLSIYKKGSKEYEEAVMQSAEKQVQAEKEVKDLLLKAQNALADAKIDNIQDVFDRERALEEQRWKEELNGLKKQLIEKEKLSDQEIAYNKTIQDTIAEKTKAHVKNITDLNSAGLLQKQMDAALYAQAKAQTDQERWASEEAIARAQYSQEVKDAKGNATKIAQAERKLSDEIIRIKTDELDRRQQIGDQVFGAANTLFGALADLAGKESALGKAMFLFQQAAAVGQVIFNTGIANAKALAASPLTFGQPWVGINTAVAAVNIAAIVAQTIGNFTGYSDGGHTGPGGKNEPAGIVHKKEYVIPEDGTDNPGVRPFIDLIEIARRNGSLARLDLRPVVASIGAGKKGYSSGGPAGASSGSASTSPLVISSSGGMSEAMIERWEKIADRFEQMEFNISIKDVDDKLTKRKLREKQSKL